MSNFKLSVNNCWQICLLFSLVTFVMVAPEMAMADDGISTVLCKIVTKLTGPIGKAIGMIALVVLGIGIFLGKLSWPLALATALGITFIFSASKIVGWLSGESSVSCS